VDATTPQWNSAALGCQHSGSGWISGSVSTTCKRYRMDRTAWKCVSGSAKRRQRCGPKNSRSTASCSFLRLLDVPTKIDWERNRGKGNCPPELGGQGDRKADLARGSTAETFRLWSHFPNSSATADRVLRRHRHVHLRRHRPAREPAEVFRLRQESSCSQWLA